MEPVRCHGVSRNHCADRYRILISPFITHDTYTLDRQQNHAGLPNRIVQIRGHNTWIRSTWESHAGAVVIAETLDENVISLTQNAQLLLSYIADDTDSQRRTWERMPAYKLLLDTHRASYTANLILEQHPERLHNLQIHLLRKTSHVMMGLDLGSDTRNTCGLYHVRINGTLCQPLCILYRMCIFVESLHKQTSDNFSLALRVGHTCERIQKLLRSVSTYHVEAHILIRLHHILELILPKKTVVHENASEIMADRLVQQHRSHCRIDSAAQTENDLVVANLLAQLLYGCVNERRRGPFTFASANSESEVGQHLSSFYRMENLRVELYSVSLLILEMEGSIDNIISRSDNFGAGRQFRNGVTM